MNNCNKMYYHSASEARKDVKTIIKGCRIKNNKKLKPYKCLNCEYWHITSMSKKKSKKSHEDQTEMLRRFSVIRKIKSNPIESEVNDLMEDWMEFNSDKTLLTCTIFKETRIIQIYG